MPVLESIRVKSADDNQSGQRVESTVGINYVHGMMHLKADEELELGPLFGALKGLKLGSVHELSI